MEPSKLFNKWNDALNTGNSATVADCYADEAVLIPTLSNQIRTNKVAIMDYFDHFLTKKPQGTIDQQESRDLGNGLILNSGIYTFRFNQDAKSDAQARFTFMYKQVDGEWKIIEHHSSLMPETA